MNGYSSDFPFGEPGADSANARWETLHTAAGAVAGLAHLAPEDTLNGAADFAAALAAAPRWKAELADSALEDISAFLQTGLTALLAVHKENRDPSAAALALWTEFVIARDGVLNLLPDR